VDAAVRLAGGLETKIQSYSNSKEGQRSAINKLWQEVSANPSGKP
jgi:hypothetical protein